MACTYMGFLVLLDLWAWEGLSARNIQRVAAGFKQMGDNHPQVVALAGIGNQGATQQHCRRDLETKLGKPILSSALKTLELPWKERFNKVKIASAVILQPHVVFHVIYNHSWDTFERIFLGGSKSKVEQFWSDMQNNPQMVDHPIKDRWFPVS
jgi:hypothetical protein